jgi:serine/threonine protein kinase
VAEDTRLKHKVALKILPSQVAADPDNRKRFQREAEAVAALDHPNIVTIHSIESGMLDEEGPEVHFFTMQLVDGEPLGRQIPAGGLPAPRLLDLATQLADALSAAHHKGILHRDLKPSNIIVGSGGRLQVLDFGLAKLRHEPHHPADEEAQTVDAGGMTRAGAVLGTVPYMSPEQARGQPADPRSDVFSIGIILYEMALGERPFQGDTSSDLMSAILRDTPRSVCSVRSDMPVSLGSVIERCLQKDPEKRYATAAELFQALSGASTDPDAGRSTAQRMAGRLLELQPPDKPSVAVLPFVNLSGDPEQDYFVSGL